MTDRVDELRQERDDLQTTVEEADEAHQEACRTRGGDSGGDDIDTWNAFVAASMTSDEWATDNADELAALEAILADLKGYGGNHQWNGDWYPDVLINEGFFTTYAEEQVCEVGYIPKDMPWWIVIDWEATARHMLADYSTVEVDGFTFFYR